MFTMKHFKTKNFFASLQLYEEIKDQQGIASACNNLGAIQDCQHNYEGALKNYLTALNIRKEIEDKNGVVTCYINLGQLALRLHKTKDAAIYLDKALHLGMEIGYKEDIKEIYLSLSVLDSTLGNFKDAFRHRKLFIMYSDSLNNEETEKKSLQSTMQYEFDKKEIATKAQQEKLNAISAEEKQKQQIIIYAVVGVLVLVVVFFMALFNRFRITQKQKKVIEEQKILVDKAYETLHEKNKEVMDSINYASRIQRALITSEKYIANQIERLSKSN